MAANVTPAQRVIQCAQTFKRKCNAWLPRTHCPLTAAHVTAQGPPHLLHVAVRQLQVFIALLQPLLQEIYVLRMPGATFIPSSPKQYLQRLQTQLLCALHPCAGGHRSLTLFASLSFSDSFVRVSTDAWYICRQATHKHDGLS